jgi:hypothetical protein
MLNSATYIKIIDSPNRKKPRGEKFCIVENFRIVAWPLLLAVHGYSL